MFAIHNLKLIETPAGQRPLRTIVDRMGMGDALQGYNQQLDPITEGIYKAFGMDGFLKLNVKK